MMTTTEKVCFTIRTHDGESYIVEAASAVEAVEKWATDLMAGDPSNDTFNYLNGIAVWVSSPEGKRECWAIDGEVVAYWHPRVVP